MIEIHARATGRVQGVGFRATLYSYASKLGLFGTVQNLSDGSVEIYLFGERETIKSLFMALQKNFDFELFQEEIHPVHAYTRFEII